MYVFESLCLLEYCPSPLLYTHIVIFFLMCLLSQQPQTIENRIITKICLFWPKSSHSYVWNILFFPVIWLILYDHHDKHNFWWAIPYHSHLCFTIIEFIHYVWILEINSSRYEDSVHFFSSQVWLLLKFWSHFFYRNHRLYETFINFFFARILLIISLQKHFTCLQIICFSLFFPIKCHQCHETWRTKFCTILVFFGRSQNVEHILILLIMVHYYY